MFLTPLAMALALVAADPLSQLTYTGSMSPVKDDGQPAVKKFTLVVVPSTAANDAEYQWTLTEEGRGGWSWLDHFGRTPAAGNEAGAGGAALLFERPDGKSAVSLVGPMFAAPVPLAKDAAWSLGRLECKVTGSARRAERDCWEIDVRSPYGHKRTLWVAKDLPLIVAIRETVFLGQGVEHTLRFELTDSKPLTTDEAADIAAASDAWNALRSELKWEAQSPRTQLSSEQLAILKTRLPKLAESSAAGPFAAIAAAAQGETKDQKNVASAVTALRDAALGEALGDVTLEDLTGKPVRLADLKNKVVVLHLWEYRDAPLEEPYGQTGYLDFLIRRRSEVVVLGVHVDPRLADADTRRGSIAAAKRLKAFMNLSYPIALDDGALLKRLGDPRQAGGKLPLFVVLAKDGKVAEYHAGFYDVKANEGLAELEASVQKAANAQ